MVYLVLFTVFTLLASCDTVKQLIGGIVVSVENTTEIDGFEVYAQGKKEFSLNAGEKKSFSITGSSTSSIRIAIRHERLSSDVIFTLTNPKDEDGDRTGGSADLVIATEIRLGREIVVLTCTNCDRSSGKSNPVSY